MLSIWLRFFDFLFAFIGLILLLPIIVLLYIIGLFDTGSPLFIQNRLGTNEVIFKLVKFRTMSVGTPSLGSHEVNVSSITKFGGFLRRTKLDELPQLYNVLIGQMSLVGPRPNLPNQEELIQARRAKSIYRIRPGITGLAQVQNIDMSTPEYLAEIDLQMIETMSMGHYFKFILMTISGKGAGDAIKVK